VDALAALESSLSVRLDGIGIGCTGPVDPFTGVIGRVDTITGWNGLNLCKAFAERFDVPLAVENDADACALAEFHDGAGQGAERFLYITVSTGIGGGAVFDGRLYRGAGGAHPEFGHHVIEASGKSCYCGASGCWEMLAAGPALAAEYAERAGDDGRSAFEVCELARRGVPAALDAVDRVAFYLGVGLANLSTLFAPDVIALGGGVIRSWPLFEKRAMEVFRTNCTLIPADSIRVARTHLGDDLALLGAARAWFNRYC
jgi:glucokinase